MSSLADIEQRSLPNLSPLQGRLLVLLAGLVFSFGGLLFRATETATAWEYLVFRGLGMFSATGIVFVIRNRGRLAEVRARFQAIHVFIGVLLAGMNALFIISLEFTSVAFVLFLQPLSTIVAAYFSWALARERMSVASMIAAAVTLVGVSVMVSGTLFDDLRPASLIALGIPLMFGFYATVVRGSAEIDPSVPAITAGLTLVVVSSTVAVLAGGLDISGRDAAISFVAGSFLLGFPLAVFNVAQRVVPSTETTLLLMVEVILAPVWVWIFVDEDPAPTTIVGGLIILVAVVWLTTQRTPRLGGSFSSRG